VNDILAVSFRFMTQSLSKYLVLYGTVNGQHAAPTPGSSNTSCAALDLRFSVSVFIFRPAE